uniref:GATA transcription factor 12-like n=1 Tax=Erigeron canadensis TaxID=72917 RepID=UPI001CB99D5E|nr:GATA transcription factor 12-like [Erigeron canadensis]
MGSYFGAVECYSEQQKQTEFLSSANQFTVDDLLVDFPNDEDFVMSEVFDSADFSSSNSPVSGEPHLSSNISSYSLSDSQFSGGELSLPYDELAELEWLSSFTEESFSSDDLYNLQLISAANQPLTTTDTSSSDTTNEFRQKTLLWPNRNISPIFQNDVLVPGKVRSKRSRAAPCDWSSRLLLLKTSPTSAEVNQAKAATTENSVRRCLHCGSDKTPQWRRGPMGPKTLCNACGVRFKSGRLVPEYRPAASPTFVPAKHSNSHRKVMELRRQMELRNSQQQQLISHNSKFEGCNGNDDYLIHRQIGPNYMHMI